MHVGEKEYHFPPKNPQVAEDGDLKPELLLRPRACFLSASSESASLCYCTERRKAHDTSLSPFLSLSRWS